ncbi:hypothetical protein PHMEG_0006437 [Phytophthora megakarya]|uniref:Ankyrin repeat-containing domain n=1 Tax=Phytophthora megakarya TaxID=4795 RepID=A0A225WP59_9STRA|nr:hypothetical protein PHMEG_0006437 [Phytophthora megakarya]
MAFAALLGATRNVDLNVIQWLLEKEAAEKITLSSFNAFKHDRLVATALNKLAMLVVVVSSRRQMVWLHANRAEGCTTNAMDYAAGNDHLNIVKWLHKNRSERCTSRAMDSVARYGHLEIIKCIHEHRTEGCTTQQWTWLQRLVT